MLDMEYREVTVPVPMLGACDGMRCGLVWFVLLAGWDRGGGSMLCRPRLVREGVDRPPDGGRGLAPPGRAVRLERSSER